MLPSLKQGTTAAIRTICQSQPIDLVKLLALPTAYSPVVEAGPSSPREALLLGSIFLLREIEIAASRVCHLSFDHAAHEVTWSLSCSKTDPMALGVSRTWGCLCCCPTLPCPYHLASLVIERAVSFAHQHGLDEEAACELPLFHNLEGGIPSKASMVSTFEELAGRCGLPLLSAEGRRLYGGHTPRVAGAQALAMAGIEVAKIRIMARHSGDQIFLYVADTPLKTLVSDLRQTPAKTSKPCGDEVAKLLQRQLTSMLSRIQANEAAVADLRTITTTRENICYAVNLHNMAIHGMRAGDGSTTRCGWKVSTAKIKRGDVKFIHTIAAEHWQQMCERCLGPERAAAKSTASIVQGQDVQTDALLSD